MRVRITTTQFMQDPTPHTLYNVVLEDTLGSVWKRYSEFLTLHRTLKTDLGTPPATFPSKSSILDWTMGVDRVADRIVELEVYLNAMFGCVDCKWRDHSAFIGFLGLNGLNRIDGQIDEQINELVVVKSVASKQFKTASYPSVSSNLLLASSKPSRSFGHVQTALSNHATTEQLIAQQHQVFRNQDDNLSVLSTVIGRQREIGTTLGRELAAQNELLDDVNEKVVGLKGRGKRSKKMIDKVARG